MTTLYADALWESPWVFSAYLALKEKNVPFEVQLLDLDRGDQRKPEFVEKTLIPRVPTLEHEGFFLSESSAIVEYLEETFPPPATRLLPSRRNERASARQIMGWLRSDLFALRTERPSSTIFFDPRTEPLSDAARADAGKLLRIATSLVRSPDATLFNTWSIVDAELAFVLMRLVVNSDPIPEPLRAYAAHQWGRPSVQSFVDQPRQKKH